MKRFFRFLCLLTALMLPVCLTASAEILLYDPVAVVQYDQAALADWSPSYGLYPPEILLELTHTEGILSVTALQKGEQSPKDHLSARLDLSARTLAVEGAQLLPWDDPFAGDGQHLRFSYTYLNGDEVHLCRLWTASFKDMLIEVSIDTWGEEAEQLMDSAETALIHSGFSVGWYENAAERTALLNDVIEDENGLVQIQLTEPENPLGTDAPFYSLSPETVILFPNPDNPSMFCPVAPDMASLVDAILTYEETSDSPALFRSIIHDGVIVYMEYSPTL